MTYKELYDKALWDLEHDEITLGEFDKMIEPLNKEIPKEEQTDGDLISRTDLLKDITKLKKSPWFNDGKEDFGFCKNSYMARKEAMEIIEDLCIKKLPSAEKTIKNEEKE